MPDTITMHDGAVLPWPNGCERFRLIVNDPPETQHQFRMGLGRWFIIIALDGDNIRDCCNEAEAWFMGLARLCAKGWPYADTAETANRVRGAADDHYESARAWADWRDKQCKPLT